MSAGDIRPKSDPPSEAKGSAELPMDLMQAWTAERAATTGLRRFIGPKRAIGVACLLLVVAGGWYLRATGLLDPADVVRMVEARPGAMIVGFVLVFAVAVATALPTLPLNLAAGFLWGPVLGGLLSTSGATIGAIGAFMVARSVFGRVLVRRFDNRIVTAIQQELQRNGWRFVAFVRLNPVFPTGPLNYLLGLTSLPLRTFAWSTFCFLLVPSWVFAQIGHLFGTIAIDGEAGRVVQAVLVACGAVALLIGVKYASIMLRNAPRTD